MKRFNYTGRKKILRGDIKVRLHGEFNEKPTVDVSIDFDGYDFPLGSSVFLEPQWKTRFMRIPLGCPVKCLRQNSIVLDEFDDSEGLDFRIKVVDEQRGVLLGVAENIKPYNKDDKLDDNQVSILPVTSVDLSTYGTLWRIEYHDQKAVLQIEHGLGSREQVVRSLWFRGFILPAAMRQILVKVVSDGEWDEELSDPDDLSTKWLLFSKQLGAGLPGKSAEDIEEWIDTVVRMLANSIGVRDDVISQFETGVFK
jgi:hypothetical protein